MKQVFYVNRQQWQHKLQRLDLNCTVQLCNLIGIENFRGN
jgi:hypothetical protein